MGIGKGLSPPPLPTPYLNEPSPGNTSVNKVKEMLDTANSQRLSWGQLLMWWPMRIWRNGFGILITLTAIAGFMLPQYMPRSTFFVFFVWMTLFLVAIGPSTAAAEWALRGASLHNQHAKRRGRNLKAQPGSDRITDSLVDVRRNNLLHFILGMTAVIFMTFTTLTPVSEIAWNMALMLTITAGLAMSFHIQFTIGSFDHLEDEEPFLSLHAPTHHPTQIHRTLSEVVVNHLDPALRMRWEAWRRRLSGFLKDGVEEGEALERVLYIVHLSQQGLIDGEGLDAELSDLYEGGCEELLIDKEAEISLNLLHRLVSHAKAWQPIFFNLIDRLQMDLLDHSASIVNKGWRMDAECDYISTDGQGGLFIFLHNQTPESKKIRVDVILPGGMPDTYLFSVEVPACSSPKTALPLSNISGEEDAIQWMAHYLDRTVVLWLKITWASGVSGLRQLSVSLKDENSEVLQSMVIHTKVQKRVGAGDKNRRSRLRRARQLVRTM